MNPKPIALSEKATSRNVLTNKQRKDIKRYLEEGMGAEQLATRYNVHIRTIQHIKALDEDSLENSKAKRTQKPKYNEINDKVAAKFRLYRDAGNPNPPWMNLTAIKLTRKPLTIQLPWWLQTQSQAISS